MSRPVFAPLCRVSYCVFLASLPLQTLTSATPHKHHYHHLTAVYWVLGDLCLSTGVGLVLVLLVESPAARLLSLVSSGKLSRRSNNTLTKAPAETPTQKTPQETKRGKPLVATLSTASYFSSSSSSSSSSISSSPYISDYTTRLRNI
ncbi:hypothetical protein Pmani_026801 [Petrolisthes manimaculis]|uniref:Uncharacterized protein n=1 Tax=Petrolisthes manimaculis TaxID=1843537 RepID=A0AAE1P5G9_9EUCA|nr:hypothetical protein Pmani_026801 [Petrolisthes manimaculis]